MVRMMTGLGAVVLAGMLGSGAALAAQQNPETRNIEEVPAGSYALDALHSKVTWGVDHYGFSTYQGQFTGITGSLKLADDPAESQLDIEIPLDQVITGSDLNEHLQSEDFFNTSAHPTATFRSTSITMEDDNEATIEGELTLNGQTHPLTIEAEFNRAAVYPYDKNYRLGFDGEATLTRSHYGIDYLLPEGDDDMGISDEVELDIEAEFVPNQE
ncbi:polyisoprenoid-binding protein YceI [Kushneria sinocarnis]|uniref:Polyisoprenoid-binding protein YceI n=1 Tax=Kushneria sinocarnis TaxID=595502 RepID=A0A420WX88_9GAMM|nr:YceI family protein [Kushneria sinocarnis]RKR04354.1 polyisoprenoid-binding protein YceI [Kushneria sinocarnis]